MLNNLDSFTPYFYPIEYRINRTKLNESLHILLDRLGLTLEHTISINLTHLPGLTGKMRWSGHTATHDILTKNNINEVEFTELLEETKDLYIGTIIKELYDQHPGKFQGRSQIMILKPKTNFGMHIDLHTKSRYQIPLITNENCYWVFEKENKQYSIQILTDDKVWFHDPINSKHDLYNDSDNFVWYLQLTSGID